MRHFSRMLAGLALVGVVVAGCSTAQTDKFVGGLANFNRGLAAVDESVQKINATVYAQCGALVTTAGAINDIAGNCSKASNYTSVANSVILNYCQAQGVQQAGITQSIAVTASSVNAAKSTLAANKKACAS